MSHIREVTLLKGSVLSLFNYVCNPSTIREQLADKIDVELLSEATPTLTKGHDFHFLMSRFGFSQEVHIQIEEASVGHRLRYRQTQGLFLSWVHTIEFEAHDAEYTKMTDTIDYQLPFGFFGFLLDDLVVRRDIKAILKARESRLKSHFGSYSPTVDVGL